MVKLPNIDLRFIDLREPQRLVEYVTEMGDLLKLRWDKHELRLAQGHVRDELPAEEAEDIMYAEQRAHEEFEQMLGAQVLLSAWAMLEGAVDQCAAFLAEQKGVQVQLTDRKKWLAPLKLGHMPYEAIWQQYYETILGLPFPLVGDREEIARMRLIRNSYGHWLYFDRYSSEARREHFIRGMTAEEKQAMQSTDLHPLSGEYPGREFAQLVSRLTDKLRSHIEQLYPYDGSGILSWSRHHDAPTEPQADT